MLVSCVAYESGHRLSDIAPDAIGATLKVPGRFVWVGLKNPGPGELAAMQHEFDLHELAVEDARHGHQRPKVEEYGDSLFAVLHMVEVKDGELEVGELNVFAGSNYVLSVRSRAEKGFTDVRARCEREPHLLVHGAGFVLYALMDSVVDRYFPILDMLETELEKLEERMFAGRAARANIEDMYALKQKLMVLKHAVGPLYDAVGKLYGGRVPKVCSGTQEYFRDVVDHLSRLNQGIDSLREMVTTALSVNLSLIAVQESETMKRLASYASLIAAPTMIAGIYGMNFEHMPELKWMFGYPAAIGLMVAIDVYLFRRFRKAGWV